jgi:hypothetical protein
MRYLALALILLFADAASAQRPNTVTMTCAQAQGLLASRGALVMSTGGHTFDRFVASGRFCEFDERVEPASAPTLDTPYCPLGYTCEIGAPFWWD